MFIPISDNNPITHLPFQYVTVGLIAANVAVYVLFISGLFVDGLEYGAVAYGVIPAVFLGQAPLPPDFVAVPAWATLITYQFWHGGLLHLASNMLFLWVFGDNVEDAMGHGRFLIFYLLCGVAGALAHAVMFPDSTIPLIGASGAVAGVIAAYLILHPRVKVWVLVLWRLPLRLTAQLVLGFWIGLQLVMVMIDVGEEGIAWWAHVGGIIAGAVLIVIMRRPGVPLFDRGLVTTPPPRRR